MCTAKARAWMNEGKESRSILDGCHYTLAFGTHEDRMQSSTADVVIVGGGPAGLTVAIALAGAGIETALVAKGPTGPDHRTTMLIEGSVKALDTLGVWARCREQAAPLRVMRIIDDTA